MDHPKISLSVLLLLASATALFAQLKLEPTFSSCSVYFPSAITGIGVLSYRTALDPTWRPALAPVYDAVNREYRGSIVRLDENTRYEVRLEIRGDAASPVVATGNVITWNSAPPIAETRSISSLAPATGKVLELVGLKGKPDGWIRITGDREIDGFAEKDYAIRIADCQYLIFERVTVKGGYRHGIQVASTSSDIRIVNCDISQWGRVPPTQNRRGVFLDKDGNTINHDAGISIDRARNIVVERCYIHDPNGFTNPWRGTIQLGEFAGQTFSNSHPEGPNGVFIRHAAGGMVLRYNDIVGSHTHRFNDAVETSENGNVEGGFNKDADIDGNVMAFGQDDGIELDGGQCNVRMFNNRIEQMLCGISTAPNKKGPSYLFNNLVWNLGDSGGGAGAGIKNGGGIVHSLGMQFFFSNTFISCGYGCMQGVGYGDGGPVNKRELFNAYTRNNIFLMTAAPGSPAGKSNNGPSIGDRWKNEADDFDYDMVANDTLPGGRGVMQAAERNESHGVFAVPIFVNPQNGVFTLSDSDPGIDRGVVVPNFTESCRGKAPDLGALEAGANSLLPIRPVDMSADQYFVKAQAGQTETITVRIGKIGGAHAFAVRKSADMDWLTITPSAGRVTDDASLTIQLRVSNTSPAQKGMIFVRLDNGFSVPITVFAN